MKKGKSSNLSDVLNDAGVKDACQFQMLFENLKIMQNLRAVDIMENCHGSGNIIRFGFFH